MFATNRKTFAKGEAMDLGKASEALHPLPWKHRAPQQTRNR